MNRVTKIVRCWVICLGLVSCVQGGSVAGVSNIDPKTDDSLINVEPIQNLEPTNTPSPQPTSTSSPMPIIPTPSPNPCISEKGSIETDNLSTNRLPYPMSYRVYTPPCYGTNSDQHYPVLYLIHGYGYSDDQWERLGALQIVEQLILNGEISPFIVVMPHDSNHNIQPPENQFGEAVIFDLIPEIDLSYRTVPSRQYRAIGGLSRGGNWAIHIGLINWSVFGVIGAHSAPLFVSDGPSKVLSWLSDIPVEEYPRFYLDVGEKDKWLDHIIRFEDLLNEYSVPHELYIFPGGHIEDYWESHTEQYIRWYTRDW